MSEFYFEIPFPSDFSFEECHWFLDRNFDDCTYNLTTDEIWKAIQIDERTFLLRIYALKNALAVEVLVGSPTFSHLQMLNDYIRTWLDMDTDIAPFYVLLNQEAILKYMLNSYAGLRLVGIPDIFEALCWSIIGQQINLGFAYKLKRRLVEKFGTYLTYNDQKYYLFPHFKALQKASIEELRAMQFSYRKAEYLSGVAQAFAEGILSKEQLMLLPDTISRQKALTNIKGIGAWSANYVLMKSLKEFTLVPHGDAGLLSALTSHGLIRDRKDSKAISELFNKFQGWESYLVLYLWRSLAKKSTHAGI